MQNFDDTKPKKEITTPNKEITSIDGKVARLKSFKILIKFGRSINEANCSWRNLPFMGSTKAGTIPSTGLNNPEIKIFSVNYSSFSYEN